MRWLPAVVLVAGCSSAPDMPPTAAMSGGILVNADAYVEVSTAVTSIAVSVKQSHGFTEIADAQVTFTAGGQSHEVPLRRSGRYVLEVPGLFDRYRLDVKHGDEFFRGEFELPRIDQPTLDPPEPDVGRPATLRWTANPDHRYVDTSVSLHPTGERIEAEDSGELVLPAAAFQRPGPGWFSFTRRADMTWQVTQDWVDSKGSHHAFGPVGSVADSTVYVRFTVR
jgi:hypothetical protein